MRDFEDLRVWQAAHKLTLDVYACTDRFPRREQYGLTSQMQRAVVSIEANIAEGCGRRTDAELHRFLQIAMGSLSELKCELRIAVDLGIMERTAYDELRRACADVGRMLHGLWLTVERSTTVAAGASRRSPVRS